MWLNSEQQLRKKLRLSGYDYKTPGYYFVTLCTNHRMCLFGDIIHNEMNLNSAGKMIEIAWSEISKHYFNWKVDSLIIMPNHVHAIIFLSEKLMVDSELGQGSAPTISLPELIRNLKSYTMKIYSEGVRTKNWPMFEKHLWQRNYYEHIIRDEPSLIKIREYIINNPAGWEKDQHNPNKVLFGV